MLDTSHTPTPFATKKAHASHRLSMPAHCHARFVFPAPALIVVGLPNTIRVMIGIFEDVPPDLREAALIDGCTEYGAFWRVAVSLVKPGVVATAVLAFIFFWNNFLFSVILAGRNTPTLPMTVFSMIWYKEISWAPLATRTIITLPVIFLTLIIQRHIVTGLTFGTVKG